MIANMGNIGHSGLYHSSTKTRMIIQICNGAVSGLSSSTCHIHRLSVASPIQQHVNMFSTV